MLENIQISVIKELTKLRLNLSHLWLLERFYQNKGTKEDDSLSYQALERRLFLVDGKITEQGRTFYDQITSLKEDSPPIEIKKVNEVMKDQFEELWENFPKNDTFTFKGKNFIGSRALRSGKKDDIKAKYWKILAEGVYTHQQILDALKSEVLQKKEQSLKKNENKLSYMQGINTWLNQRTFESFLNMEVKESTNNVIDI